MSVKQKGHCLVVGSGGGAGASSLRWSAFAPLTTKKMARAVIRNEMMVMMKAPQPFSRIRMQIGAEVLSMLLKRDHPDMAAHVAKILPYIEPGSPWENGYIESFNGKLRDELLDREIFYNLRE